MARLSVLALAGLLCLHQAAGQHLRCSALSECVPGPVLALALGCAIPAAEPSPHICVYARSADSLAVCAGYSFLSCSNYNITTGVCLGYPRKYIEWVGAASHAYNLAVSIPAGHGAAYAHGRTCWPYTQQLGRSHVLSSCAIVPPDGVLHG